MIYVRRSFLEKFREVVEGDYVTEAELIDSIMGEDEVSWQMKAGTAWHAALESNAKCSHDGNRVHYGDFSFDAEQVERAMARVGPGRFEVPGCRQYTTPRGVVKLTARADHIAGLVCTDSKTCFSGPDARDYEQKLQWRVYMAVHGVTVFRYLLWDARQPDDAGFIDFKGVTEVRMYRYPEVEDDVRYWVERFADWARSRDLFPFLEKERADV